MENILITGGAGLIGSHLIEDLLNDDFDITCVDNFITGQKKNIEPFLSNSKFHFIQDDASQNPLNFLSNESNFQYIFHLASPASPARLPLPLAVRLTIAQQ